MPHKSPDARRAYHQRWREANPERNRALNKASYDRHKEEIAARRKGRATLIDPSVRKERNRQYSAAYRRRRGQGRRLPTFTPVLGVVAEVEPHRPAYFYAIDIVGNFLLRKQFWLAGRREYAVRRRQQNRAYHLANKERRARRQRERYRANPAKYRLWAMQHWAHKRGARADSISAHEIVIRDRGRCGICGKLVAPADHSFDHIVPLSKGGAHSQANLRLTHLLCNISRGNRGSAQTRLLP